MDEADSQPQAETPVVPQRSTPPPPRTTTPQPPNHALSLSLPVHNTPPAKTAPKTANGSSGDRAPGHGRDDCWSEGATNTLIEAWGTRYLELNRGNLKQKHWKDVADAVSNRENGTKPRKTDIQCKNRLDTLKKKYKLEKNKMISSSGGGGSSKWAFFNKLDELIGPSRKHQQHPHHQPPPAPPMQKLPTPSPPMKAVPIKHRAHIDEVVVTNPQPSPHLHHHLQPMVMPVAVSLPVSAPMNLMIPNAHCHMPPHLHVTLPGPTAVAAPNSASSKSDETPDTTDSYPNGGAVNGGGGVKSSSFCKKRKREDTDTEESPLKDLTRAIMKFGEIYERVESSKVQQLIDLEKQRMVFLKDLEIQRMEYFMQAHVEMTKLKQERRHQQRSDEQREHNNNNNGNRNDNTGKHIESPPERIATPNSNSNCCLSTNSVVVSETLRSSQFMLLL